MRYTTFGRTGLHVSVLGYGCAPLGLPHYLAPDDPSEPATQERFAEAVRRAVELGVNYFDTAPGYGDGASERLLGRVLADVRDRVILATKAAYRIGPGERSPIPLQRDGSLELQRSIEQSLRRLRTDRIDVLQLHGGCYTRQEADHICNGGLLDRLRRCRDRGLVRFIGVTAEVPTGALETLIETDCFDVLQICYNVANRLTCDHSRPCRGVAALAKARGMGVASMRTATSGFLQRLLAMELGEAAKPEHVTAICLKYVLSTPEIDVALVGMRGREEVERNAALADDAAARYDLEDLHDRYRDRRSAGKPREPGKGAAR